MNCDFCKNNLKTTAELRYPTGGRYDIISKIPFTMPHACRYCGGSFCEDHLLPEKHDCIGLKKWKEQRIKDFREGKAPIFYKPGLDIHTKKTSDVQEKQYPDKPKEIPNYQEASVSPQQNVSLKNGILEELDANVCHDKEVKESDQRTANKRIYSSNNSTLGFVGLVLVIIGIILFIENRSNAFAASPFVEIIVIIIGLWLLYEYSYKV